MNWPDRRSRRLSSPACPTKRKANGWSCCTSCPTRNGRSFCAKLPQLDLPNLWKPRADQFFRVDHFPLLGTGKLDLRKVKEVAQKLATSDGHR